MPITLVVVGVALGYFATWRASRLRY